MKKYTIKTFIISTIMGIIGSIFIAPIVFLSWIGADIPRYYTISTALYDAARFLMSTDRYYISYIIAFAITFVIMNIIKKRKNKVN